MFGVKIVTSIHMVVDGEPYEVPRTWKERLFSRPWRPMRKTRTEIPKVPSREALQLPDGSLVMHPAMATELRRMWDCGHKGPAVDCTGRTSEDCCADKALNAEMKRLWNAQTPNAELRCASRDSGEASP